jgi:hypothetical protein
MKKLLYYILAIFSVSCKDAYDLPVDVPATGYLVVDGTINSGQGPTVLSLSKTTRLVDTFNINYVTNAVVEVQGQDNSKFPLTHTTLGQYRHNQLNLNPSVKYRLYIKLPDGRTYESPYLSVKSSPAIDTISYELDNALNIYANAHGGTNSTRYYRWDYDEAWEFRSAYAPNLKYNSVPLAVYIFPTQNEDFSKFVCYQYGRSTSIEVLSTAKLSKDTTHYRLHTIPKGSWKVSVLYSIEVRQHSISREGYEYLSKMKKNTEQTGSLFDAQPSELKGNIVCVTNPQEPVIGFLEISQIHAKRIFIKNSDLPGWGYYDDCPKTSIVNHKDSIQTYGMPAPVHTDETRGSTIISFFATRESCIDCTMRGSLPKPSYWP